MPVRIWTQADPLPKLGTEKIDKVGLRARFRGEFEAEVKAVA
jgi:long-chain acyl-CoA synthetase